MKNLFDEYLRLSESVRRGYVATLGQPDPAALSVLEEAVGGEVPALLQTIYTTVEGTNVNEVEDSLFDFIPGFQLIHLHDWAKEYRLLKEEFGKDFLPVLAGEEGAYYALDAATGEVLILFLDEFKLQDVIFEDAEHFLQTIIANYNEKVYFVDEDGWLDFDDDEEVRVARRLNPNVSYWEEGWGG